MLTHETLRPAFLGRPSLFASVVAAGFALALLTATPAWAVVREKAGAPPPRTESPSMDAAGERSGKQTPGATIPRRDAPAPRGIIVVPEYSIDVDIWTDRYDYYAGDSVRVFFQTSHDAWVYIFNIDTDGRTYQIYPNYYDRNNRIEGGWRYRIPDRNYDLIVTGPPGREHLRIVAVPERFDSWERRNAPSRSRPYPEVPGGVEQFMHEFQSDYSRTWDDSSYTAGSGQRVVRGSLPPGGEAASPSGVRIERVEPAPRPRPGPPRYAVAWTSFYVHAWRSGPPYLIEPPGPDGRLIITSEPTYATVLIDDRYVGRTPLDINLPEGTYNLRIYKSGYDTWVRDVRIRKDRTVRYSIRLKR